MVSWFFVVLVKGERIVFSSGAEPSPYLWHFTKLNLKWTVEVI